MNRVQSKSESWLSYWCLVDGSGVMRDSLVALIEEIILETEDEA